MSVLTAKAMAGKRLSIATDNVAPQVMAELEAQGISACNCRGPQMYDASLECSPMYSIYVVQVTVKLQYNHMSHLTKVSSEESFIFELISVCEEQ
jgi:hypothetical protein